MSDETFGVIGMAVIAVALVALIVQFGWLGAGVAAIAVTFMIGGFGAGMALIGGGILVYFLS